MKESQFQRELIKDIKALLPKAMVLKNDPSFKPGIPDLLVLHKDKWAALEVKQSATSRKRPNQEHYVDKMNSMSYASFVYPENKEEVLNDLERTLGA